MQVGVHVNLADFIREARTRRGLNFRELESKADDLDHAYIWRLEKGDKTSPSPAAIEKLAKALSLDEREREIFRLLADSDIEDALYELMMTRQDIDWAHLEPVATMSFRGQRPTTIDDWLRIVERVQELF